MKFFTEPSIEIEKFNVEDVITTSLDPDPEEDWGAGKI